MYASHSLTIANLSSESGSCENKGCRKQEGGEVDIISGYFLGWVASVYIMISNIEIASRQTYDQLAQTQFQMATANDILHFSSLNA